MRIMVDGRPMDIEDGTTATFVGPDGKILLVGTVDGDQFRSVGRESVMSINCDDEEHSEVETIARVVPALGTPGQPRVIQAVRICRNASGNIVKCPPR